MHVTEPTSKPLPNDQVWLDGAQRDIVDRRLITRYRDETEAQRKARAKTGAPAQMISYVVGRIV